MNNRGGRTAKLQFADPQPYMNPEDYRAFACVSIYLTMGEADSRTDTNVHTDPLKWVK